MCRIILAVGKRLPVPDILAAACGMSQGRTADHDGPITCHPNGWGAVWRAGGRLVAHRDVRPMWTSLTAAPLADVRTDVLAVHVRHRTLATTSGVEFTHPLGRGGWYFMHNGFLPTVYRALGLPASRFDSGEYFDYVVPEGARELDRRATLHRLRSLPPGGNSGNAVAMNRDRSYVIHWSPADTPYPRYFTMHRLRLPDLQVISSEVVPALAPRSEWTPLDLDDVVEITHPNAEERTSNDAGHSRMASNRV